MARKENWAIAKCGEARDILASQWSANGRSPGTSKDGEHTKRASRSDTADGSHTSHATGLVNKDTVTMPLSDHSGSLPGYAEERPRKNHRDCAHLARAGNTTGWYLLPDTAAKECSTTYRNASRRHELGAKDKHPGIEFPIRARRTSERRAAPEEEPDLAFASLSPALVLGTSFISQATEMAGELWSVALQASPGR